MVNKREKRKDSFDPLRGARTALSRLKTCLYGVLVVSVGWNHKEVDTPCDSIAAEGYLVIWTNIVTQAFVFYTQYSSLFTPPPPQG